MSAAVTVLLAELAHQQAQVAKARGAAALLERVCDALMECPLTDERRRRELVNVYRELTNEGPPITVEQAALIDAFLLAKR